MLRAYCSEWDGRANLPLLEPAEIHHLVRVRRVRVGEPVEVLNGRGDIAQCVVEAVGSKDLSLRLESSRHVEPLPLRRHLLVAMPKGKTFPALLHKAVELGVDEITPLLSDNAEVPADKAGQKWDRYESILVEAIKQSGNPWMLQLNTPVPFKTALSLGVDPTVQRLCAALQPDAQPLGQLMRRGLVPSGTVEVMVGPEGDFSPREYAQLRDKNYQFISLGPLVLKVETATSLAMGALGLWAASAPEASSKKEA